MRRGLAVRVAVLAALAAVVAGAGAGGPVAPVGAGAAEAALTVLGQSDLGGHGLNGDVAVVGTTAIVGGGLIPDTGFHTERYSPLGCGSLAVFPPRRASRRCLRWAPLPRARNEEARAYQNDN